MERTMARGLIVGLALGLGAAGCGAGPVGGVGVVDDGLGGAVRPAKKISVQRSAGGLGGGARAGQGSDVVLASGSEALLADYGGGRVPGASLPGGVAEDVALPNAGGGSTEPGGGAPGSGEGRGPGSGGSGPPAGGSGPGAGASGPGAPDTAAGGGTPSASTSDCVELHREPTASACFPDAYWIGLGTTSQGCQSGDSAVSMYLSRLTLDRSCSAGHGAADFLCCPSPSTASPAVCEVRSVDLGAGACYPTDLLQARASSDCGAEGKDHLVDAASVSFDAGSCSSGSARVIHFRCCRPIG